MQPARVTPCLLDTRPLYSKSLQTLQDNIYGCRFENDLPATICVLDKSLSCSLLRSTICPRTAEWHGLVDMQVPGAVDDFPHSLWHGHADQLLPARSTMALTPAAWTHLVRCCTRPSATSSTTFTPSRPCGMNITMLTDSATTEALEHQRHVRRPLRDVLLGNWIGSTIFPRPWAWTCRASASRSSLVAILRPKWKRLRRFPKLCGSPPRRCAGGQSVLWGPPAVHVAQEGPPAFGLRAKTLAGPQPSFSFYCWNVVHLSHSLFHTNFLSPHSGMLSESASQEPLVLLA